MSQSKTFEVQDANHNPILSFTYNPNIVDMTSRIQNGIHCHIADIDDDYLFRTNNLLYRIAHYPESEQEEQPKEFTQNTEDLSPITFEIEDEKGNTMSAFIYDPLKQKVIKTSFCYTEVDDNTNNNIIIRNYQI